MTQHERILRYLVAHPGTGMTIRDAVVKLNINWPHKRISELEERGIGILRGTDQTEDGVTFRRYYLRDPDQDQVHDLLEAYAGRIR